MCIVQVNSYEIDVSINLIQKISTSAYVQVDIYEINVNLISAREGKPRTSSNRFPCPLNIEYICYYPKHILQTYLRTAILKA